MLNRIKYDVHFPTPLPNGRRLSADLTIGPGYWAITGPNESGKSMIFEVARWLLFGIDALRGKTDDYKTMKAEGEFIIKGNVVEITRTSKTATFKRNGELKATGTTGVNKKVVEELGFGLKVFDIACSINQGEVEKLGSMKAGERKAMIDQVLGLAQLDLVATWAVAEAKVFDKSAESFRERLTPPAAPPIQPPDYTRSQVVRVALETARQEVAELAGIEGWLANPKEAPIKPEETVALPSENLRSMAAKRAALREEVARLKAQVAALPESAPLTAEQIAAGRKQIDDHDAYLAAKSWLTMNPHPGFTLAELTDMRTAWDLVGEWKIYDTTLAAQQQLQSEIDRLTHVNCPACDHDFVLDQAKLADLTRARDDLFPKEPSAPRPATPALHPSDIDQMEIDVCQFDATKAAEMLAVELVDPPPASRFELDAFEAQIARVAERAALMPTLAAKQREFETMPDHEAMLASRLAYEAAIILWREAVTQFESWSTEAATKRMRQRALEHAPSLVIVREAKLAISEAYERELENYDTTLTAYNKGIAVVVEMETKAKEYRKVREVMAVLRGMIKQHVLPSLNVVASQLLRQMTGGQRGVIVVDEEFEVLVDTQDLNTLSGSGKACANLSLRIALGQVLTNRIISMMFADEIDASMDDFRAEQTADVLSMLEQRVSQVILVSHKDVVAPNNIRLGAS